MGHVLDTMCHMAKEGVQIMKDTQPIPDVVGDSSRITQILFNLVGNAIKFTEKGKIIVSVLPATDPDHIILMVKDTGVGIPSDKHTKIFQAFEQVWMAEFHFWYVHISVNLERALLLTAAAFSTEMFPVPAAVHV